MRKVISPNFDTARVQSARVEASVDTLDKIEVMKVHPSAKIQAFGARKRVVRRRFQDDEPALIPYVFISGEHYTAEDAWKDAALAIKK